MGLVIALVCAACASTPEDSASPPTSLPMVESTTQPEQIDESPGIDDAGEESTDPIVTLAPTPEEVNTSLGRGINLGNALDGPRENTWGPGLEAAHFVAIREAGFDHVRLPVSWAGYADLESPYKIPDDDPTIDLDYGSIWERVEWAIDQAEQNDLLIVLNLHHYDELHENPDEEIERFLAMWEQISVRFADAGDHVILELLNEPNGVFSDQPELWTELFAETLAIVRETHPTRTVIVGPVEFNAITALEHLTLPDDPHLLVTVHVYSPFEFTHQGAVFADPILPTGVSWSAEHIGLSQSVDNSSWDTTIVPGADGLAVQYGGQWKGFAVDLDSDVRPSELRLTMSGDAWLRAGCRTDGSLVEISEFSTQSNVADYVIDLSACPDTTTGIFLMNTTADDRTIVISGLDLCTSDSSCQSLLSSQRAALEQLIDQAAEWSATTGHPINIGEFGAFSAGGEVPVEDRASWTRTVRDIAEGHGMSTSYWEFYRGFGAFDPESNTWVPELLEALMG